LWIWDEFSLTPKEKTLISLFCSFGSFAFMCDLLKFMRFYPCCLII
jgi:hypothetical protein